MRKFVLSFEDWRMTEEEKKLLGNFEARIRHMMYVNNELKRKCAETERLLQEKAERLDKVEADYSNLQRAYSSRKAAIAVSLNGGDINETKQKLSALVREVDKCIALLKGNN